MTLLTVGVLLTNEISGRITTGEKEGKTNNCHLQNYSSIVLRITDIQTTMLKLLMCRFLRKIDTSLTLLVAVQYFVQLPWRSPDY